VTTRSPRVRESVPLEPTTFEFTESILVQAPPARVWEVMSDVEGWWQDSNPEHERLERLDGRPRGAGPAISTRA
jgi:uncharacterized protein YndB with AHSA1/START domain